MQSSKESRKVLPEVNNSKKHRLSTSWVLGIGLSPLNGLSLRSVVPFQQNKMM